MRRGNLRSEQCEVCLLLTFRRAEAVAKLLGRACVSLTEVADAEKLMEAADKAPPPSPGVSPLHVREAARAKASAIALLQYTSGFTGYSEGRGADACESAGQHARVGEAVQLGPGDVGVSWLPLYHDMGLIAAWLTAAALRIPLAVMSPAGFFDGGGTLAASISPNIEDDFRGAQILLMNFAFERSRTKIIQAWISVRGGRR